MKISPMPKPTSLTTRHLAKCSALTEKPSNADILHNHVSHDTR